jgi:hypothetical protein
MVIEEWVQTSREEKRQLFGKVGLHDDCVHYGTLNKKPFCNACTCWSDGKKYSRKQQILQCEKDMCFFYEPKRKDGGE